VARKADQARERKLAQAASVEGLAPAGWDTACAWDQVEVDELERAFDDRSFWIGSFSDKGAWGYAPAAGKRQGWRTRRYDRGLCALLEDKYSSILRNPTTPTPA
jgi:hypothetical protein